MHDKQNINIFVDLVLLLLCTKALGYPASQPVQYEARKDLIRYLLFKPYDYIIKSFVRVEE